MASESKLDKIRLSYKFFREMQSTGTSFSCDDIVNATGWGISTINTYKSKKWSDILTSLPDKKYYANINSFTEDAYVRMMSQNYKQSLDPFKPELPEQVEEFVVKARDSAILSIDIYNRPIVSFRSQGYIVMMIIAWTALFHAIYEMDSIDYFYKEKDGNYKIVDGDKKSWELDKCVDMCQNLISEAVKINLRLFISLRNKIEHRYVPTFDFDVFGECQALLLNFEQLITEKFGSYYALNNSLSFPLQVSSTRNNVQTEITKKIQAEHYKELKQYIDTYRSSLDDSVFSDNKYSFRVFLIPQLGNHRSSSDCAVEFVQYDPKHPEEFDAIKKDITLIKEKRIPVANQGKYKPQMICNALSEKLGIKISISLHTKAWKHYKVRNQGMQANGCNTMYCQFDEAHNDYIYTQDWIEFLYKEFQNPDRLEEIRNQK